MLQVQKLLDLFVSLQDGKAELTAAGNLSVKTALASEVVLQKAAYVMVVLKRAQWRSRERDLNWDNWRKERTGWTGSWISRTVCLLERVGIKPRKSLEKSLKLSESM